MRVPPKEAKGKIKELISKGRKSKGKREVGRDDRISEGLGMGMSYLSGSLVARFLIGSSRRA